MSALDIALIDLWLFSLYWRDRRRRQTVDAALRRGRRAARRNADDGQRPHEGVGNRLVSMSGCGRGCPNRVGEEETRHDRVPARSR
jgi:hypothetical protein